jgi:hypothetical protein
MTVAKNGGNVWIMNDGDPVSPSNPLPVELSATPTIDIGDVTLLPGEAYIGKVVGNVANASFRVHFYRAAPSTITNGDNGAFSTSGVADYIGAMDVTMDRAFTDGAAGFGQPVIGSEMNFKLASGQTVRALIEARGAYTPANAEVFTLTLDSLQD